MGSTCNYHIPVQDENQVLNRKYQFDLKAREVDSISCWTDYFRTGNMLLVDGDGEWVDLEDEEGDDQWEDDDNREDDEW